MRGRDVERTRCQAVTTILLVDDDTKFLRPLRLLLEAEGYRVLTATDGEVATAITVLQRPNLIVTDWMMPRVDGMTFCRRLKADPVTDGIPVVMLSAAEPASPTEPLWDVLLRKPVSIGRLLEVISSLLGEPVAYRRNTSARSSSDGGFRR
ncbi:response regulator [Paraburkholderia hospita]|jgi:DNA-binding response OmpR family regulator|uniref:response regulator n=1 Tax=Paraburkholderia hospita TaxID=169430 RepID=UPI003ED0B679